MTLAENSDSWAISTSRIGSLFNVSQIMASSRGPSKAASKSRRDIDRGRPTFDVPDGVPFLFAVRRSSGIH